MRRRAISLVAVATVAAAGLCAGPVSAQASVIPTPGALASEACSVVGQTPGIGGALQGACNVATAPLQFAQWLTGKAWGALNSVLGNIPSKLTGAVKTVVEDGANTLLDGVSGWIASGAVWLTSRVAGLIQTTTSPQVGASWFAGSYAVMGRIAIALGLPLLLFAIGRALLRRDAGELARSVAVYLPLSALLTAGAVVVTQMALAVTDNLSNTASAALGTSMHSFFAGATRGLLLLGAGNTTLPGFVVAIAAVFAAFAAFVLWIELILRSAAIYVVLLFLPLAFIALIWPTTVRLARRMVEILAAVIFSKLVIVAIIALAASGMVHAGLGSSIDAALAGIALMGLAVFAPWTLLRMLPLMEAAVAHHEPAASYARGSVTERMNPSDHIKRAFGEVAGPSAGMSPGEAVAGGAGSDAAVAGAGAAAAGAAAGLAVGAGAEAAKTATDRARTGGTAAAVATGTAGAQPPGAAAAPQAETSRGQTGDSGGSALPPAPHQTGATTADSPSVPAQSGADWGGGQREGQAEAQRAGETPAAQPTPLQLPEVEGARPAGPSAITTAPLPPVTPGAGESGERLGNAPAGMPATAQPAPAVDGGGQASRQTPIAPTQPPTADPERLIASEEIERDER